MAEVDRLRQELEDHARRSTSEMEDMRRLAVSVEREVTMEAEAGRQLHTTAQAKPEEARQREILLEEARAREHQAAMQVSVQIRCHYLAPHLQ